MESLRARRSIKNDLFSPNEMDSKLMSSTPRSRKKLHIYVPPHRRNHDSINTPVYDSHISDTSIFSPNRFKNISEDSTSSLDLLKPQKIRQPGSNSHISDNPFFSSNSLKNISEDPTSSSDLFKPQTIRQPKSAPIITNKTPIIDNKTPVIENKTPVIDNKTPFIAKNTTVITNKTPVIANKTPVINKDVLENNNIKISENEVVQRILNLAKIYVNNEFKVTAKDRYFKIYGEHLSDELLNSMKLCVNQDNGISNFSSSEKISNNKNCDEFKNNEINLKESVPGVLNLKDISEEFWVNINKCNKPTEIWGTIVDENHLEKVSELAEEMKIFYDSPEIKEGSFYALLDGSWHRVKCVKCDENDNVTISFIDRGDQDIVKKNVLHRLDERFCLLPAQAIKMSVSNLNLFEDNEDFNKNFSNLLFEEMVFVKLNTGELIKNDSLSVQLYIKKGEEIQNVVNLITNEMISTVLNPHTYIKLDKTVEARVSHVDENGSIFIQLYTKSLEFFENLMKKTIKKYFCNDNFKRQIVVRCEKNKIYFIKDNKDGYWYRVRILKFINESEICVSLIDIGSATLVKRENLILIEKLCHVLAKYPDQAIEVNLLDGLSTKYNSKTIKRLKSLVFDKEPLYVKFLTLDNKNIPTVELLKKTPSGFLKTISNSLIDEKITVTVKNNYFNVNKLSDQSQNCVKHNSNTDHDNNLSHDNNLKHDNNSNQDNSNSNQDNKNLNHNENMLNSKERLKSNEKEIEKSQLDNSCKNLCLSSLLKAPSVPENAYFDVHVATVTSPSKFVVQLLRHKALEFTKMECEMSRVCSLYTGPTLNHTSIQIGQLYAGKCDENDKMWYRFYVTNIIDKKTAIVYFCDYGTYSNIRIENLIPLQSQFYMPYQAVWAELHGVQPISENWTMTESSRFRSLVDSKDFVCCVHSKKKMENTNNKVPLTVEIIYEIELIDTSTPEDIYISEILINEGVALES